MGREAVAGDRLAADQSKALRRALHLRPLPAGDECPQTPGGRRSPKVAITLGDGPAYPVPGMSELPPRAAGVASLRDDIRRGGLVLAQNALGGRQALPRAVASSEGRGSTGPGPMRFGTDYEVFRELEMPAEQQVRWRYGVSSTLLRGPGCYAFQVDGTNFSDVIVFAAKT